MPRKRALPVPADGSKLPRMVGAVIYVRVSTKEQTENLSLPTQLRACEEYCRRQGYEVLERFHEEGESAKTTDRSQLQKLLTYCRLNKGRVHFVVVFNLTRFARDKYDHFALRSLLQSLGISLRSATEPIDDTSTGKLMEGVLAAFAQFDNDCRSDRTRAGMKAALELGRWWVRAWGLTNRRGRRLTSQAIGVLLRNQLYAGIVDVTEYRVHGKARGLRAVDLGGSVLPRAGGPFWPADEHNAEAARAPGFPAARVRPLRCLRTRPHRQLAEAGALLSRSGASRTRARSLI